MQDATTIPTDVCRKQIERFCLLFTFTIIFTAVYSDLKYFPLFSSVCSSVLSLVLFVYFHFLTSVPRLLVFIFPSIPFLVSLFAFFFSYFISKFFLSISFSCFSSDFYCPLCFSFLSLPIPNLPLFFFLYLLFPLHVHSFCLIY